MLSCVMKRSQTSGYSMRGSDRVGGWCGFVWVHSYNAPLCLDCSASYGPILAHIPSRHPLHHQICSRATETGGGLGLCIFLLSSPTWSPQRKRPVWWPCGQIYLSCSGKHKLGPFQEWTLSTCARCRESHEAHMHAHLSVDDSCHHHIRGIGTSMTRLRQVNYLSFWFSFCSLLLPPTSHSSNIAPLVMHKLVPFSHSLSCSSCRHPPPLSTFNFPTTFIFILSRYLDRV